MSKKHILIRTVSVINITHKKQFAPDNLKHLTTTIQNEMQITIKRVVYHLCKLLILFPRWCD